MIKSRSENWDSVRCLIDILGQMARIFPEMIWSFWILDEIHRKQLKHGVPGPLTTKRYAQPKHKLYKMMFQVPHTYPAGAYKMLLVFMFFDWKADVLTVQISRRLFVVSTSWISDYLWSITVLNLALPQGPFCRQPSMP